MKKVLFTILIACCFYQGNAAHIKGGFFTYQYLGPGINDPGNLRFRITLNVYMLCTASDGQIDAVVPFTIYKGTTAVLFEDVQVAKGEENDLYKIFDNPCITGDQSGCYYKIVTYILDNYELPVSADGYTISYQRCCRIAGMQNVTGSNNVGNTWTIKIPGTATGVFNSEKNSSPVFPINDTAVICGGSYFSYAINATDPDGDSLVYTLCDAYNEFGGTSPDPASPPPYTAVPYTFPFSGTQPLGAGVTINPATGLVSGIAPVNASSGPDEYVITVCVQEYRNGIHFADSRKELHIRVKDCIPLRANPDFVPITCDGYTVTFNESSTGNPNTFFWDFGDPSSGSADTSTQQFPTHTFSVAGSFNIKLKISQSGDCTDSITKPLSVFPGFFPGFTQSPILCINQPIQFNDTTFTAFGIVDSWFWDFGDPTVQSDTSHFKTDSYTYTLPGIYTVKLKVTNSKGCEKTIQKDLVVSAPPSLSIFPSDTTYCGLDTLALTATGTGSFNWLPNINIIGANTATPLVFPSAPTKYRVSLTNAPGCVSKDSVTITPKLDLSNTITGLSPICEEDTITLSGTSNYVSDITWQWSPAVESPTNSSTRIFPTTTTNYTLITKWGTHCVATTNKIITVKPLAIPNAGPSRSICGNQKTTQLNASGGNTYSWSPVTGLSDPAIANPIASPPTTTIYTVAVGVTGCPKTRSDSLIVTVKALPALTSLNDTLICNIDTLQLTTTGTGNFTWSPNYMISGTAIASPLVSPDVPTKYFVTLTDAYGCINKDSVFVDVKNHVNIFAGNDTSICKTDGLFLFAVSDALHYKWIPSTYLNADTLKQPFARPLSTVTYTVVGNIGKCQTQDDVVVKVAPYPPAYAGLDTSICLGFSAQLHATGGSSFLWTPATFLNNRNFADPVSISPTANIRYIVAVTDTLGCPKPVRDTVWVNVYPKVIADAGPKDTSVVLGETLLLNATGGSSYLWSPSNWLNNPNIQNPVALPQNNIQYIVTAISNPGNCIGRDTISVKVFKVDPDMYVPNAFTPNGDGNNDVLRPILLGMKSLRYFRVYNRWGNLLFSTSDISKGWDGTYGGKPQDPATYVWMAEGVNYKGDTKFKKGTAILIR